MSTPILEMKNITKTFPGVKALDDVTFSVQEGEIHGLVGENGAGKSTLMKVLSGVHPHGTYTGEILFEGDLQKFHNISESEEVGIGIIYQELALVPEMTVYENIFLGHELSSNGLVVDWNETIKRTAELLERVGLDVNPSTKVRDLGVGKQQLVEIAKALHRDVKLLILDEPTAALNEDDSQNLLNLLKEQRKHGVTCILITHKLKEVIQVADTVTVLRDGQTVCTLDAEAGEVTEQALIKHMVGREITNIYPEREHAPAEDIVLEVRNWSAYSPRLGRNVLTDVNFNLRKGEILGFAGLVGSGRTELSLSIFGNPDGYRLSGDLFVGGKKVEFGHPSDAIRSGVAYLTEDRKDKGLILIQDVKQNITLANLEEISERGVVDNNAEIKVAHDYVESLDIKTPSIEQEVENLSGGNQQKVCVGKWLFVKPNILILDEPTRGIDVGAKYEIYTIMNELVKEGISVIMISSELPEVLGMSDRIYVVSGGRIAGEMPTSEATQEKIMDLATDY